MKILRFVALATFVIPGHADLIHLKDGSTIDGKVVSEADGVCTILVNVSETIRDERRVKKDEIARIDTTADDEIAFEKITTLTPTPDLLAEDEYRHRIELVEAFLEERPRWALKDKAIAMLETLQSELDVISAGGIKFEGKLIPAAQRTALAYPLDARIAAEKVTTLADSGRYIAALRAWDRLQTDFGNTGAYAEAIPFALRLMRTQLAAIQANLDTFDSRVAERAQGLELIPANDRSRIERLIEEEAQAFETKLKTEQAANIKWLSLDPFHRESLESTARQLESEIKRLQGIDHSKLGNAEQVWRDAWATLSGEPDPREAMAVIRAARSARIPPQYLDILEGKITKP